MSDRIPNICVAEELTLIDDGTMCRAATPPPGVVDGICLARPDAGLDAELRALQATAVNFGARFIKDAATRRDYLRRTAEMSAELRNAVAAGELSAEAAARRAAELRNAIMEASRIDSSQIGRAVAENLKASGKSLAQLQEEYAVRLFKKNFDNLTDAQRTRVYVEIVEASGRPRPSATKSATRWGKLGKGLVALSVGLVVYDIWVADDKFKAAVKGGATTAGGAAGGAGGGALAGMICGPGAPVCVGVGILIGGGLAALGTDWLVDWLWD